MLELQSVVPLSYFLSYYATITCCDCVFITECCEIVSCVCVRERDVSQKERSAWTFVFVRGCRRLWFCGFV